MEYLVPLLLAIVLQGCLQERIWKIMTKCHQHQAIADKIRQSLTGMHLARMRCQASSMETSRSVEYLGCASQVYWGMQGLATLDMLWHSHRQCRHWSSASVLLCSMLCTHQWALLALWGSGFPRSSGQHRVVVSQTCPLQSAPERTIYQPSCHLCHGHWMH